MNRLHHPSLKNKGRRRVVLITACVVASVVVAAVILDPRGFDKSVEIQFDWEPAKGISDISVEWPPFGSLYNLAVYVDESLAADEAIVFNAGTHRDAIRLRYDDFVRLAKPRICSFAQKG